MAKYRSLAERFWSKVDVGNAADCWAWKGAVNAAGYGILNKSGKELRTSTSAHRLAWILCFSEIPNELDVGHKCSNKACTNPAHLYLTSRSENLREIKRRGNYVFPETLERETIAKAILHAQATHAIWEIKKMDLELLSDGRLVEIFNLMSNKGIDSELPFQKTSITPPVIMPCGHPYKFSVHTDEGTGYCLMCEHEKAAELIQRMKAVLNQT